MFDPTHLHGDLAARQVSIPRLVRVKAGALERLPTYLERLGVGRVAVLHSEGFVEQLAASLVPRLQSAGLVVTHASVVQDASYEAATAVFAELGRSFDGVVGFGGGKALDVAKYVAFLAQRPFVAVPTSLAHDGFCSPQSSLTVAGARRSLPASLPVGVVIDTDACLSAPLPLFCSGVGDLSSKLTAVRDWKLAFHARGEPVDDFAALLSDATVFQFLARPEHTADGVKLLATALLLNGVAMSVCGSSRPASGSEHLISHALDALSARPRLHGLQVGVATYLMARLQGHGDETRVAGLFDASGFWDVVRADPFEYADWDRAFERAPTLKGDFYTVLSSADHTSTLRRWLREDPQLAGCFR